MMCLLTRQQQPGVTSRVDPCLRAFGAPFQPSALRIKAVALRLLLPQPVAGASCEPEAGADGRLLKGAGGGLVATPAALSLAYTA